MPSAKTTYLKITLALLAIIATVSLTFELHSAMDQTEPPHQRITVSVADQSLTLLDGDLPIATWPISTSRFGLGSEEGSYKTPLGNFEIAEMIGHGAPSGTIFKGRVAQGQWTPAMITEDDLVLTRILWLHGLDPENANTHERYIYIHGTNQEDRIGTPASMGCLRMTNPDVIDLFDRVTPGTPITIAD